MDTIPYIVLQLFITTFYIAFLVLKVIIFTRCERKSKKYAYSFSKYLFAKVIRAEKDKERTKKIYAEMRKP